MVSIASLRRPSVRHTGSLYFPALFALLAVLSLVAFWDNLVTDVDQPSNSQPRMIIHGLFAFGWMLLLFAQALLIRSRNLTLHRRLGLAAFGVAIGVTLSTLWLFVVAWKGWAAMTPEVQANRILLPSFSLAILAAYLNRQRPAIHKRLVTVGTLFLMEPILARVFDPLVGPLLPPMAPGEDMPIFYGFMIASWSSLFASLAAHDWKTLGRVHPITAWSFGWLVAVYVFAFAG